MKKNKQSQIPGNMMQRLVAMGIDSRVIKIVEKQQLQEDNLACKKWENFVREVLADNPSTPGC